jgi:thiol-disulfide isomerase/thioredoxin
MSGVAFAASAAVGALLPQSAGAAALDLNPFRGKVVYLDFWASWCGPCKLSFPFMEELKRAHPKDLAIVAVNLDRERERAEAFLATMNSTLQVVYDPRGDIARSFKVKDMPTSVLIGRDSRVREVHPGFFIGRTDSYSAKVQELINEN